MKPVLILGSALVTFALLFYSIAIFSEQRKRKISVLVLSFLTLGIVFDISATVCMIAGSTNSPFTFHGFIGYIGLMAMIIETILSYRFYLKNAKETLVTSGLHLYSKIAYVLWLAVYATGTLMVAFK